MRQTYERDTAKNHRNTEWVALRLQEIDAKDSLDKMRQPEITPLVYKGISEADTDIVNRIARAGNAPRYASDEERTKAWQARQQEYLAEQKAHAKSLDKRWDRQMKNELEQIQDKLSENNYSNEI